MVVVVADELAIDALKAELVLNYYGSVN